MLRPGPARGLTGLPDAGAGRAELLAAQRAALDLVERVHVLVADPERPQSSLDALLDRECEAIFFESGEPLYAACCVLWELLQRGEPRGEHRGAFKWACRGVLGAGLRADRRRPAADPAAGRALGLRVLGVAMQVRGRDDGVVLGSLDVARLVRYLRAAAADIAGGADAVAEYVSLLLRTRNRPHHTEIEIAHFFGLDLARFRPALVECVAEAVAERQHGRFAPSLVCKLVRSFGLGLADLGGEPAARAFVASLSAQEQYRTDAQLLGLLLGLDEALPLAAAVAEVEAVAGGARVRLQTLSVAAALSEEAVPPPLANGYVRRLLVGGKLRKQVPAALLVMQTTRLVLRPEELPEDLDTDGLTPRCELDTGVALAAALLKLAQSDMERVKAACRELPPRWWRMLKHLRGMARLHADVAQWPVFVGVSASASASASGTARGNKPAKAARRPRAELAVGARLVDDDDALGEALAVLMAAEAVGVDAEWPVGSELHELSTLQLATPEAAFVLDVPALSRDALAAGVRALFGAAHVRKVGYGMVPGDLERLDAALGGLGPCAALVELQTDRKQGLSAWTERALGRSLDKRMQCSDWRQRPLSAEQLAYAALDAQCLLRAPLPAPEGDVGGARLSPLGYVELRVGRLADVRAVDGSELLLRQEIDLGERGRAVAVSAFAPHFAPEELLGRLVVAVVNVKPRRFCGVESTAGVLCAYADPRLELVSPPPGARLGHRVLGGAVPVDGVVIDTRKKAGPWVDAKAGLSLSPACEVLFRGEPVEGMRVESMTVGEFH